MKWQIKLFTSHEEATKKLTEIQQETETQIVSELEAAFNSVASTERRDASVLEEVHARLRTSMS